jgi:hypothetical protein
MGWWAGHVTFPKGIPKKEILMAYIINHLMPENPKKIIGISFFGNFDGLHNKI